MHWKIRLVAPTALDQAVPPTASGTRTPEKIMTELQEKASGPDPDLTSDREGRRRTLSLPA